MSILIDESTRVVVQGITGNQGRYDTRLALEYGVKIVAGVTPGRGGEEVEDIPVFDTVAKAVTETGANAAVLYVPVTGIRDAVTEAAEAGIGVILATTENVPKHDAICAVAAARKAGAWLVGFNTNGVISPGKCKLGGIGGDNPDALYPAGRIGVVSRSGGMSAEISMAIKAAGRGVSTAVSMGGDRTTGRSMCEYLELFEADDQTDAMVIYGEPGTGNEAEVAAALRAGRLRKPVVAIVAGRFQENHPRGVSFGHVAAMIGDDADSASSKIRLLWDSGAEIAHRLDEIGAALDRRLGIDELPGQSPDQQTA
ncbi:MAG: succinate--CoA ligase subunit alpha [Aestuariivita sp.]|uniref:succinate--CoA ligase subunit alpha n=1 Tax=Aestuariivita sp. TaxID=1872407 RepID=UPI003BB00EC6